MGILIYFLVVFALFIFLIIRNNKVCKFRIKIINFDYNYSIRNIDDEPVDFYSKLVSYNRMVFSIKPLKVKYWFNEEDAKFINDNLN